MEPRPVPLRDPRFDHLPLEALRLYRKALEHEEGRVSYWRRIIQARLDMVRAGTGANVHELSSLLSQDRMGRGRQALVEVLPADDVPPLPDLESLWSRTSPEGDEDARAQLETDLVAAEAQLSDYRRALHERLGAATTELIARYREEPALCLSALPVPSSRGARGAIAAR